MKTMVEKLDDTAEWFDVLSYSWAKAISERIDWLLENARTTSEEIHFEKPPGFVCRPTAEITFTHTFSDDEGTFEKPDGSHIVDTEDIVQNYVRALAENKAMKEEVAHMRDVVSIYEDTDKELREQNERLRTRVKSWKEEVAQANGVRADAVRLEYGRNRALTKEVAHLNDVIRELKKPDWKDNVTYAYPEGYDIWDAEKDYGAIEAMYLNERTDNRELRLKVQTLEADREVLLLRLQSIRNEADKEL